MAEAKKKPAKKGTMKGHSISGGQKRPTKSGAGMTKKGVAKYRRDNPGSKLKTAVQRTSLQVNVPQDVSLIVPVVQVK